MTLEAIWDGVLGWVIRLAGLFWVFGGFMLFRQIRMEMSLDKMTSQLERALRDLETEDREPQPASAPNEDAVEAWIDRDDAARRGWIAGQAVVLIMTGLAMMLLHPLASGLVALLVLGQGVYFIWRETMARRAPSAKAASHARPSKATVNAGWVSLTIGCLVWTAAYRGILN